MLPTVAVQAGGRAAWMVAVMSGVSGFGMLLIIGKLAQRFRTKTIATYATEILGPWLGKGLVLVMALNFSLNASVDIGVAMKNLEGIYFETTPPWMIALILVLMSLAVVWWGIVHASRIAWPLLMVLAVTFAVTFPLLWRWVRPGYLIPVFDPTPINWVSPEFWVALGVIRAGLFPVTFLPYVADARRAVRVLGWAHWVGWLGDFMAVLAPVLVFSPEGARAVPQPFPYVLAVLRLPNFPLERWEMLGRLVFHINTFYAVGCIYFTGAVLIADVFRVKTVRPFMLLSALVSMLPIVLIPSGVKATEFAYQSVIRGLILSVGGFGLLWLVYWVRGMGRRNRQEQAMA